MIKLYQREACAACARVRRLLESQNISYQAIPVPKVGTERAEVLALAGTTSPEVPVLVDGDTVIQGSDKIEAHLRERHAPSFYGDPSYALTRRLTGHTYNDAVPAVRAALAEQGFGVLTEIDVKATLKKKLDADFRNYVILGACAPPFAHKALTAEPGVGVFLPCNVIVTEEDDGTAVVSAIDPMKMFQLVERPDVEPLAKEVGSRLKAALEALG